MLRKARFGVLLLLGISLRARDSGFCTDSIIVNVRDHQGQQVAGLLPSSFHATVGKDVLKIMSATIGTAPPRIVLLLDQSGSINGFNGSLDAEMAAAEDFVDLNEGKAHVAVVVFSDHVIDTIGFDRPRREILQKLSARRDGKGQTAFYDSLIYGASLFGTTEPGDAVYAITDGGDNRSKSHPRDVEHKFVSKGVRLFAFVLSHRYFSTEEESMGRADLAELVEATGGAAVSMVGSPVANQADRLRPARQSLYDSMERFYHLELEAPSVGKESRWKLEVIGMRGKKRKDVEVDYPRNLAPCRAVPH